MQDIDHFSEAKMSAMELKDFKISLPESLRSKFIKSSKGIPGSVLQGYKGPSHLRNGESGDSATEEPYLGVQKVGFWFAVSKKMNYFPISGNLAYGICRTVESFTGKTDWCYIYFKAGTGKMIDADEATNIQNGNRKAEEHYEKIEKLMKGEKFEEAFNEAKIAFDTCSDGYEHQGKFKNAMDKAQVNRATQLYKEADLLGREKKYKEALELYKTTDKLSLDSKELEDSKTKQASMLNHIGDQLRNDGSLVEAMKIFAEAEGMTKDESILVRISDSIALIHAKEGESLFNEGKFQEAKDKFQLASRKTRQSCDKDSFSIWLQRIETELEALEIKEEGDLLLDSKKYNEAIVQYKLALQTTKINNEKKKIKRCILIAEQKLQAQSKDESQDHSRNKTRVLEIVTNGLALMCEGSSLRNEGKLQLASAKYDEAAKCFEQAAKITPLNVIFNSLLKLINAYHENQDLQRAHQLIEKVKFIFPNKSKELDEIKENIEMDDWSLDYLKKFMMQAENKEETTSQVCGF